MEIVNQPVKVTQSYYDELKSRYSELVELNNSLLLAYGETVADGGWHDNFAMDDILQQLDTVGVELNMLTGLFENFIIVENEFNQEVVAFGSIVGLYDTATPEEPFEVSILGDQNLKNEGVFVISEMTPLGHAILGKKVGETVSIAIQEPYQVVIQYIRFSGVTSPI